MRHRLNVTQDSDSKHRPSSLQPEDVELLKSTERPQVSAVFGESAPPVGLSGMIRRFAFKYGKSHYGHWLLLLLADRVNVVEGVLDDLRHGHIPDIFAEKDYETEWEHNKIRLIIKLTTVAALVTGTVVLLSRKDRTMARPARGRYRTAG